MVNHRVMTKKRQLHHVVIGGRKYVACTICGKPIICLDEHGNLVDDEWERFKEFEKQAPWDYLECLSLIHSVKCPTHWPVHEECDPDLPAPQGEG